MFRIVYFLVLGLMPLMATSAATTASPDSICSEYQISVDAPAVDEACLDVEVTEFEFMDFDVNTLRAPEPPSFPPTTIYAYPYSMDFELPQWHRMWINTAVLSGAFVTTLFVLECLPENATSWNRAELQKDSPAVRWFNNIFKRGPEWDHDNPIFNYVLHPYAGAVYFMSARSCGFNFWHSMLYSACISTIGWEFGIEACMERPSIQDIFITPIIGSMLGEGFYHVKRHLADNDYRLLGSRFVGGVVGFLVDPVNELIDLFRGNPARRLHGRHLHQSAPMLESSFIPSVPGASVGFSLKVVF